MHKFKNARDSLKFLVKEYGIKELHIPYYLCSVIRHSLFEVGCKPIFYHIDDNFYPLETFAANDFILYPNYFGICSNNIKKLAEIYPKLIVDNAHAYYAKPSGFASFNSKKKFFPKENISELYIKNERHATIIDEIALKRRAEFLTLHETYKKTNLLDIQLEKDDIPFCYPCLLKTEADADKLVKHLKSEGKIIYRYWDVLPKSYPEHKFYSRLVPIPII